MIHVMANTPFKPGTAIVSSPGVSAPAADYFEIKVQGSGCHGSMPNAGVDPINVAAHILIALQEMNLCYKFFFRPAIYKRIFKRIF